MAVLSKTSATLPKSNNGVKFIEKSKPLDIVIKINPTQCTPTGIIVFDIEKRIILIKKKLICQKSFKTRRSIENVRPARTSC